MTGASLTRPAGALVMAALVGCLVFAAFRALPPLVGAENRARDLAQALFCYQISPHYVELIRSYKRVPKTNGFELCQGATLVYAWIFFSKQIPRGHTWPLYPPFNIVAQAVYLTKHIMPKRYNPFDRWLKAMIEKLSTVAAFPDARTDPVPPDISPQARHAETVRAMGPPLSLSVVDVLADFDPTANASEIETTLASLDWEKNQFLRSPMDMVADGFQVSPYTFRL